MGRLDPRRDARAGTAVGSFGHRGAQPVLAMLVDGRLALCGRARAGTAQPSAPAVRVAALARIADTSRQFAADCLGMASSAERAVVVGAELARFATAPPCGTRHEGVLLGASPSVSVRSACCLYGGTLPPPQGARAAALGRDL